MAKQAKRTYTGGFVLLYAVTLAGILLAIALGVASIASKEVRFGSSARETNAAFFAADSGVECAVFHDRSSASAFPVSGQETSVNCASRSIPINHTPAGSGAFYDFIVTGLGASGDACALVSVEKDTETNPSYIETVIISRGYNVGDANCAGTQANRVERVLEVRYFDLNPTP